MEKFIIKIYGRVQGIGYRWFILENAKKYNLYGWVKNCDDGSVECGAKGLKEDIDKFIEDIKKHPLAKITKMDIEKCSDESKIFYDDFKIIY